MQATKNISRNFTRKSIERLREAFTLMFLKGFCNIISTCVQEFLQWNVSARLIQNFAKTFYKIFLWGLLQGHGQIPATFYWKISTTYETLQQALVPCWTPPQNTTLCDTTNHFNAYLVRIHSKKQTLLFCRSYLV